MEEEEQEQVYNFEGSDGQKYSAKKSELPELVEQAKAAGVVLKGVMSKEESTAARDDDYWTWDNAKAGVRGIWDDPTGEHGALAYMGLNVASGIGTALGKVFGGMVKGAADVGFGLARGVARGVESLVGADGHAVSGSLGDWHDSFNEITDALTPDLFEKRGMYDGIEGAHETMGAINSFAESVFAMKGMGLAAKGVGAIAGGRKAAAIGQAVVAAGMGGKGYAEMAEDPKGPGGWRQELAAAAKGGIEAAMFGVLGPWKKMKMAMPKPFEQLTKTEIVKRFALEALKSGGMMAGVAATKEGVEALATAGTDQQWNKKTAGEVFKTVMSEFLVGSAFHAVNALGKSGAWLAWRADRKNGEGAITFQVEQNRKTYAPIMDRQAQLALRAREVGAGWLEAGMEGTENVKRVLPNGAVQFDDGSVWQVGKDGRATITVADGTILDARTGAVEGYRANREADVQRDAEGNELPKGETRAENAAIMLDALERGELPTVAEPLEGLQITETSYKKGTVLDGEWDQAKAPPVIVWVGNDGTRVLVTGRSRAAGAAAAGVKEIKAVEVREDQGWSRQQAESLDAVENMREGRGTREEIARGVEALGIRSEEDCDRYGIVPERPVVEAITVANEGSEALKSAATEGTVGRAWAAECAEKLGKKSLGEASERAQATALDMIAGKLPREEAGAAMDAIAELAARKPDYTDREAADAIRAARERAVGRVAVDADSEMVEMPDGTIKSVAEAKAEGAAEAQEAAAEGKTVDESGWLPKAPAAPGADKAAEPTVKADGSVGCVRFEGAKATRTRSEDGHEIVLIEGMTGEEMMRPENRDAAVQFVTRLKEMAGDVDLVFADVSAADAAEALLMAARVKARAEESGRARSPSAPLVDAGQRLVDGLFGEKSGIRVRTGTREEAEAALRAAGETKPIKDDEGQVQGYYHRGKGEVVLFEGADAGTLAHEIGWHAVWHWAERNSPDLLLKMKRYAARTPLKLKALIKDVYGDFKGDALMDEIGAGRFERAMGERFQKLLAKSPEVRGWWRKVLHALARAWKGMARTVGGNRIDLKKIEKMDPEEAIEALTAQMLEGRRLGEGRGNAEGEIRPSIGGIYTGTAADYANRSRQGGKEDGPSLKKIGTGEGSQVYGWGLYGSTVRGVAEGYAGKGLDRRGERVWTKGGKSPNELTRVESDAAKVIRGSGSREQAIRVIEEGIEDFRKDGLKKLEEHYQAIKKEISEHGDEYAPAHANLYEQTFFTERAPGDESHLLKWYEDLPKEQVDWIAQEFAKEGFFVASFSKLKGWTVLDRTSGKKMSLWDKRESGEAYEAIAKFLGSPQAASELLARAGIDGVKYPVDSYGGKGVKDGDEAGWNYISFRDDNIRVDHKWTDGQLRFSIGGVKGASQMGIKGAGDAEAMEKAGKDREEIWRTTGWWRGKDGKWRFELPSTKMKDARALYAALIEGHNETTLGKILDAPELFEAYPQLKDTKIILSPEHNDEAGGWYDRIKNEIVIFDAGLVSLKDMPSRERDLRDTYQRVLDSDEFVRRRFADMDAFGIEHGTVEEEREYARWWIERQDKGIARTNETKIRDLANDRGMWSIFGKIIHEVQHTVQRIEGFATGASGNEDGYGRFAGEVEARNASRREAMTPEERAATPPWATEDVPEDSQIIRYSRAMIGGKETAVAEGYPLSIREARDPEKVLGVLSPLVGKSAAQIGEMKLTRINAKSIEHMINSEHARADIKRSGKSAKKLWRGTVAGMSVTDDIVATSTLGTKEQPKHLNAEWKKGATFYRAKTRFAVETEEGRYEIYPCELIVAEKNGERIVYDITEIGAPTLSAAASQKGSTVGSQLKDGATAHGGVGATPQSISQQGGGAQGEIRPQIRKRRDEVYDDVLRAVRAGGQRVAAGRSERTEAGFDAGAALWMEREGQLGKSQDGSMTLSYSEALRLYRAMSASAHMPKVLEKMPHLATRDRKGRLRLNAAAFGIVDRSDMEAVKAGLKKDGMFLHEDPSWRLHNDFEEVRAMKEMSEQALAEEMEKLAEARITGKMSGGGRTAVNILAKEIGRIACELPVTAGAPQSLKDLRKLGLGIARELGDPKGELGKEAREAARWWREQDPVRKDPTATKSEDIAESELWAEMFGMFLADPMALQERAPNVYGKMVEAIAGNEKLSEAWNALRRTRDAEGPHERVMRDIERQWQANEQSAYKELLAELDKPIGNWKKRTRARLLLEMHSTEGPAVMWVTDAVHEKLAELKRLKKAGKIDKDQYDLLAGGAKRELEKLRVALLHKQRGGATGRLYALDFAEHIMDEVAKDGVQLDDLRRYLYAKSVRDGMHQKGKAAALGMDQREADKVLTDLEGRLGADGWTRLETAAKRFQALREQHILENEFVLEAFGRDLVGYWRMNASYVRSERTWTAEEVEAYRAAREDWMKRHPGESTVIAEIEALMDMHVAKGSGTAGSSFLKPLAGSLKAVKDPIAATLENDLRIIEFAQRNHWACQLAESAKTLGMEGFAVMEDRGGGGKLRGSNRYGSVTFLKDGKRMTLVMPKVVAEGFEHDSRGVSKLVKLNRWASAILTQYSPRFALRNIWRNRASNANNIAWMGEGRLVTGMGMVGMRPVARLATFLLERAASHLPDRFARNALMNVLYGSKTNLYWEAEATRIAKLMQDPKLLQQRIAEADRLAGQGKTAQAQRIMEDVEKCRGVMKLPIFAGVRKQIMGESGKTDIDELMRTLGMETNLDGTKLTGIKRVKRWMQRRAETVKRFNDFEEARVKLIALLAAQHEAELAQARGEAAPRSRDEITYQVATMSGSPRYENRGRAMNYIEFACGPFMNVGMKGAWRTVESMRYDPKSWWTKAAGRIAGRLATYVLWMGGGYKVVADWLRGDAGDDEDKKKRVDAFERFGKRMAHALANVSDYRLRNYDIVPVGLYGKWSTLAISMPRGDEDRLLMPTVDLLANGMLGSEKAQEMGFALPTDLNYGKTEAAQNTFFGSGLLPDSFRRGILWTVAQDLLGPVFGINPYNSFTQRTVYSQADFDARWEEPWNMAKKVGKQVWNDVGGQVVMPATTWDEDEGAYDDQGQWALSGAEEGEAGCMPIGGKTIFQALHSIPFLSSAASGLITFQNGGNERIARRLEKYRRDDAAPLRAAAQRVADEVVELVRKGGQDYDYNEMLESRVAELELPEEDKEIIQGLAWKKVEKVRNKMGCEFDPIGKVLEKMSSNEKMYRRAKRQVEAEGWDGDFD